MDLRPAEVTSILEKEIENYESESRMESVGTVLSVGDGVSRVYGLDDCMMNELLEFPGGVRGVALNLEEDNVGCVLLGDAAKVREGDTVKSTGRIISVPTTSAKVSGRIVPDRSTIPCPTCSPSGGSDGSPGPVEAQPPRTSAQPPRTSAQPPRTSAQPARTSAQPPRRAQRIPPTTERCPIAVPLSTLPSHCCTSRAVTWES